MIMFSLNHSPSFNQTNHSSDSFWTLRSIWFTGDGSGKTGEEKTIALAIRSVIRSTQPTKTLQTGVCLLLYRGWKPLLQVVCLDSEIAPTGVGEVSGWKPDLRETCPTRIPFIGNGWGFVVPCTVRFHDKLQLTSICLRFIIEFSIRRFRLRLERRRLSP